jgi:hypothetical protein
VRGNEILDNLPYCQISSKFMREDKLLIPKTSFLDPLRIPYLFHPGVSVVAVLLVIIVGK